MKDTYLLCLKMIKLRAIYVYSKIHLLIKPEDMQKFALDAISIDPYFYCCLPRKYRNNLNLYIEALIRRPSVVYSERFFKDNIEVLLIMVWKHPRRVNFNKCRVDDKQWLASISRLQNEEERKEQCLYYAKKKGISLHPWEYDDTVMEIKDEDILEPVQLDTKHEANRACQ